MLCYKMSLRGQKGVQKSIFFKCSNWAETFTESMPVAFKHDKHILCYKMSLRSHKGVRKTTFLKCSNWVETWLIVCLWHFKHEKAYALL